MPHPRPLVQLYHVVPSNGRLPRTTKGRVEGALANGIEMCLHFIDRDVINLNIPLCPVAGTPGKRVTETTLRALLRPERQANLAPTRYRFCATPGCDVVYYAEDGSQVLTRSDLSVRVGVKEAAPPRPVCYCFGYSVEDMIEEIRVTGRTTIPARIRARLESDGCHCETTNPQGSCCLGVVMAIAEDMTPQA